MSISSEITRLQTAKANIKTSIENKGVTVPSATKLDGYPTLIDSIPSGGSAVIEPLSVTENGTYTAPTGVDGYSPVSVNVSGGGGGGVSPKQINFYDYDGTCLHSFTAAEWANETALPSNPSHTGLVAQGWNWSFYYINQQLIDTPNQIINVGQMYVTDDDKSRIYVRMQEYRLHPYLGLGVNGTVVVDWGDDTPTDTLTGTSVQTVVKVGHTYASAGDYMITLTVLSGEFAFLGSSQYSYILYKDSSVAMENRVYGSSVTMINIGRHARISSDAFKACTSLRNITIPLGVITFGATSFVGCKSLEAIVVPEDMKSLSNAIYNCPLIRVISVPKQLQTISSSGIASNEMLESLTLPSAMTAIENYTFSNVSRLTTITINGNVTRIGAGAFNNCYGMKEYHFLPTTPPTLDNVSAFTNIPSDCIIYVPSASLNAYKTATNWSTYASKMQGE